VRGGAHGTDGVEEQGRKKKRAATTVAGPFKGTWRSGSWGLDGEQCHAAGGEEGGAVARMQRGDRPVTKTRPRRARAARGMSRGGRRGTDE
jgi:hypothetical protein